jgi:hypothetical protein
MQERFFFKRHLSQLCLRLQINNHGFLENSVELTAKLTVSIVLNNNLN